jgi:hypothetical protein
LPPPEHGRSIAPQLEIRKMGMKVISLPGKHSFFNWRLVIGHRRFAEGAGYRLLIICYSPEALPQASQVFIAT